MACIIVLRLEYSVSRALQSPVASSQEKLNESLKQSRNLRCLFELFKTSCRAGEKSDKSQLHAELSGFLLPLFCKSILRLPSSQLTGLSNLSHSIERRSRKCGVIALLLMQKIQLNRFFFHFCDLTPIATPF